MSVYIDNFRSGRFAGHMGADTREELDAMADAIGLNRKWIQAPGTPLEHYDVMAAKRRLAVQAGAIEVCPRDFVLLVVKPKRRTADAEGESS